MTLTPNIPDAPKGDTREIRALRLFEGRGAEIVRTSPWTYNVPSCTGEGFYVVRFDKETCDCPDFTIVRRGGAVERHRDGCLAKPAPYRPQGPDNTPLRYYAPLRAGLTGPGSS